MNDINTSPGKKNQEMTVQDMNSPMSVQTVKDQVNLIQHVMKQVMKKDEHYGVIPGCGNKPTLFKAGAEKLIMTFRLAPTYDEMRGSRESDHFIGYKMKCTLVHMGTGQVVGEGLGACNSKEKKYRSRSVYPNKATAAEQAIGVIEQRKGKDGGKYDVLIIPQDPWDNQNTVYKMACKRALVAATLNATAASDIFTQDIAEEEEEKEKKPVPQPQRKTETDFNIVPFGNCNGKTWSELNLASLEWYEQALTKSIAEPKNAQWKSRNEKYLAIVRLAKEDASAKPKDLDVEKESQADWYTGKDSQGEAGEK